MDSIIEIKKININNKFRDCKLRIKKKFLTNYENPENNNHFKNYYDTLNIIGEGLCGIVKKCLNKQTNKIYAVKIIKNLNNNLISKIESEYEKLKELKNINIIQLKEIFIDYIKKRAYIVMEYFESDNLFSYISKSSEYSEFTAKYLFTQILEGIKYLHDKNITIKCLNPNNILVSKDGKYIKLIFFSIFKSCYKFNISEKLTNEFVNEENNFITFYSPEIFLKNKKFDKNSDCWSLGCILYTILIGKQPFLSENFKQLKKQISKNAYEIDFYEWINLSKDSKNLISNLLKLNPKNRLTVTESLNHPWLFYNINNDLSYCCKNINQKISLNKNDKSKSLFTNFSRLLKNKIYFSEDFDYFN